MKKIIAVILALVIAVTLTAPAYATEDTLDIPIVNITGKGYTIKNADGSNAFTPNTINREEYISEKMGPVLKELPMAVVTDDYSNYIDALVDAVAPLYKDWVLDSEGSTKTSGSYIPWDYKTAPIEEKTSGFELYDYVFNYDWRLSPLETADQLDHFIERVCQATGHSKINLYGRCLGSNIAMAYLAKDAAGYYDHKSRVQNVVFNTPPISGYIAVGALLSGSIEFDPDTIDQFVTYYLNGNDVFEDPLMEVIASTMVSVLNYGKVLGWGIDVFEKIFDKIVDDALPRIALSSYGSFPAYWSMISDKYFDKAIETVFNSDKLKNEYSVFIDKVVAYHELVSKKDENGRTGYEKILLDLKNNGAGIAVYAKYGYVTLPLFEGSNITGDTRGTVTELSFGATATKVGSIFSKAYLADAEANGTVGYISPDHTVDASTCLFRDTTWFEKVNHGTFPPQMDILTSMFFASNGKLTVDTAEGYSRFMELNENNVLVAVEGEDVEINSLWSNNGFAVLYKFIVMIFHMIVALFNRA